MGSLHYNKNQYENKDGLNVTLLSTGIRVTIETIHSIYQIKIVEGREVTLLGGMTRDGEIRFHKPTPAILLGSSYDDTIIKPDWIGKNMCLKLKIIDTEEVVSSSRILNLLIESKDSDWYYSMDWNK